MSHDLSSLRLYISCASQDRPHLAPILEAIHQLGPQTGSIADIPDDLDPLSHFEAMLSESSALLLFVTRNAPNSGFILRELDGAHGLGVPVIIIHLEPEAPLPPRLEGAPIVRWQGNATLLAEDLGSYLEPLTASRSMRSSAPPRKMGHAGGEPPLEDNLHRGAPTGGAPSAPRSSISVGADWSADPKPPPLRSAEEPTADHIEFSALTPGSIESGSTFALDIWAYLRAQREEVKARARELGRDREAGVKAGVSVTRGSLITVQVKIRGLQIEDDTDFLTWDGEPANVTFFVDVPSNSQGGTHPGTAVLSIAGVPFAKLKFLVQVAANRSADPVDATSTVEFPRSAFASYASHDRTEVLRRLQGIELANPYLRNHVFLDARTLAAGDDWEAQLRAHVPTKDIFYLFWSAAARDSEWVEREWRLALQERGLDYITPVPLEDPRLANPPSELGSRHFNDAYLAFINYEDEMRRRAAG